MLGRSRLRQKVGRIPIDSGRFPTYYSRSQQIPDVSSLIWSPEGDWREAGRKAGNSEILGAWEELGRKPGRSLAGCLGGGWEAG